MNHDVANLAKELHDIIHYLQSHMALLHYTSPASSYSYGIPMAPPPNVTASSDWPLHVPLNVATGPYRHTEAIGHAVRNVWCCTGTPSQGRSSTLLYSSSPGSSCLHLCCSDREGAPAHMLQSQCGSCQASRMSPNSSCMSHSHGQAGSSLLSLSSAFSSFPVACQAHQGLYNTSVPTLSNSLPVCSSVYSCYTHPSLSGQAKPEPSNQTRPQTPIHSSITPTGQPQYHTAFSSLNSSGVSVCTGHTLEERSSINSPRQNEPMGSSSVHPMPNVTCSLLGQVADRGSRASVYQERTDDIVDPQGKGSVTPDQEPPLVDMSGIQKQQ